MSGTNSAVLELSSIPPINLGERLDYLLQYPYGCLEQTLSGGFPQLYVGRLIELNENQKKTVPANIKATIERLKKFQTSNGGFAYWPGEQQPDQWFHFLRRALPAGGQSTGLRRAGQHARQLAQVPEKGGPDLGSQIGRIRLWTSRQLRTQPVLPTLHDGPGQVTISLP